MNAPKSKRHIAFVERVIAGEPLGEAWGASARDVGKEPGTRAANNVAGSRMAARFADFIAAEKARRADARNQEGEPVTRESIHTLLEEVTSALMDASRAASAAGADGIAQQLHKVIVVHAGRSQRADARAPQTKEDRAAFDPAPVLTRLHWCACDA